MKARVLLFFLLCALPLWSQFLTPYTAAEGTRTAIQTATQSGLTNLGIDAIYTTADTSLLAGIGGGGVPALSLNFSFERGTNTIWLYSVRGRTADQRDTSIIYAIIKLFAVYQAFPLFGIPGLENLADMRGQTALPSTFMNSDVMVRKLAQDSVFRSYRQQHPRSILLGASLAVLQRGTVGSTPAPLWSVLIGEGSLAQPGQGTLTCFVPAADTTGTAQCIEVPLSSIAASASLDQWAFYPNPATDVIFIRPPAAALAAETTVDVCSVYGDVMASYRVYAPAAGNAIAVPVSSLASGVYMVRYRTAHVQHSQMLVISR